MAGVSPISISDITSSSTSVSSDSKDKSTDTRVTDIAKASLSPLAACFISTFSTRKIRENEIEDPKFPDDLEVEILDRYNPLSYDFFELPKGLKLELFGPYKKGLESDVIYYCSNEDSFIASVAQVLMQFPYIDNSAYI